MSRTSALLTMALVGAFAGCAVWLGSCWAAPTRTADSRDGDRRAELGPTGTLHLVIVDQDGNPVPDLLVLVGGEDPTQGAWLPPRGQLTDQNGVAVVQRVPGGTWPVRIPRPGWSTSKKRIVVPSVEEDGKVLGYDLRLRQMPSIPGRVVDPKGQPIPFIKLVLHHASNDGRRWSWDVQAGLEGDFELFRQDTPTTLRIEVQQAGYRTSPGSPMTFELDGSPIEVVLTTSPNLRFG